MNLQGLTVIVTRPEQQSQQLCSLLTSAGSKPVSLPMMSIISDDDAIDKEQIKQCILDLDHYHHVIAVSTNAAQLFHQWVDQYWPQLPIKVNWLAVGEATANRLKVFGYPVSHPEAGMNTESLLSLPELQQLTHQKVLICRGIGGRETLAETLQSRGAKVDYLELYYRSPCRYNRENLRDTLMSPVAENQPTAILISSGEGLQNLTKELQQLTATEIQSLLQTNIVVPSERVAELAESMGYQSISVADNATDQAMMTALAAL